MKVWGEPDKERGCGYVELSVVLQELFLWVVQKTKTNVSVLFKWMQKVKIPILGSIYFSAIQLKMVMG